MPLNPLKILQQATLPGVKVIRGVEAVRPGVYSVDPSKLSDAEWLRRAEKQLQHEYDISTTGPGLNRPFSTSGHTRAMPASMTLGALNELKYAAMRGTPQSTKEAVKGVVAVDKGGNVRGAAAINKKKADEYLGDEYELDFTKPSTNYLEYVGVNSPEFSGSGLLRDIQKLHGDDMVFQVANPKKNVPIYEAMGAERMPLSEQGYDVLGGDIGLPAFRIEKRIPEKSDAQRYQSYIKMLEKEGQERLPGFKNGGQPDEQWSFAKESAKRRKEDDATEAAIRGNMPGTTRIGPWDGKRGRSLTEFAQQELPANVWGKQAQEQVGAEALLGSITPGMVVKPAMMAGLAALGAHAGDAQAGTTSKLLKMAKGAVDDLDSLAYDVMFERYGTYLRPPATGVLERLFHDVKLPAGTSPVQLEALQAYIKNPAPFKPHVKGQRAAIESAVKRGTLSAKQGDEIENTRKALNDLLTGTVDLRGQPVYRGVVGSSARPMEIIGGDGPASFSFRPEIAEKFAGMRDGKRGLVMEVFEDQKPTGLVVPARYNAAEEEVILHPSNRVLLESRGGVKNSDFDEGHGVFYYPNAAYDAAAWKRGGLVSLKGARHGS